MKSSFLHGELSEIEYVEQPLGNVKKGRSKRTIQVAQGSIWTIAGSKDLVQQNREVLWKSSFIMCPLEHTLWKKTTMKIGWPLAYM